MNGPLRTASLGMYDLPWLRPANDALWTNVAERLRAAGIGGVPDRLDRGRTLDSIWRDPDLLLAQTCGYPLVTAFAGRLRPVATPVHDLPGCDGWHHRSFVVVRAEEPAAGLADLRGRALAVNGPDSNSGMNLLRAAVAPLALGRPFFSRVITTGAHLESLAAVAAGAADVAAIDCVTHGLVARHRPDRLDGLRVLTATAAVPGLPLVTRAAAAPAEVAALREALDAALADPASADARAALGLAGFVTLPADAYDEVAELERSAAALGYPALA